MNKGNEKHFGLRVDGDILAKFGMFAVIPGAPLTARLFS